jgi:hypothetical protein
VTTVPLVAVIDDDDPFRTALVETLCSFGYRVHGFASAEQFIAANVAPSCDCIITDLAGAPQSTERPSLPNNVAPFTARAAAHIIETMEVLVASPRGEGSLAFPRSRFRDRPRRGRQDRRVVHQTLEGDC